MSGIRLVHVCGSASSTQRGRIELGDINPHNIKQLKKLNQVVFPVTYNDKFYKDALEVGELAKLAYYNDIVVGAVCCRVDTSENQRRLYIMTLGALAPYRRLGIGTVMWEHVQQICERDGNFDNVFLKGPLKICTKPAMRSLNDDNEFWTNPVKTCTMLASLLLRHVQVNNEGAIKFYEKHGFKIVEEMKNYYKHIEPADAYVLQKTFRSKDDNKLDNKVESNKIEMMQS